MAEQQWFEVERQQRSYSNSEEEALGLKVHISNAREGNNIQVKGDRLVTPRVLLIRILHNQRTPMQWMSIRHEQGGESYLLQLWQEGHFKAQCPEPRKAQRAQNTELSYGRE